MGDKKKTKEELLKEITGKLEKLSPAEKQIVMEKTDELLMNRTKRKVG